MQSVAHGMIEILMPVGTFLRSGLTVWEQESPHFREGRKSSGQPCAIGLGTTGAYLGHRIENADWNKVGEDYKDYIHKEIKSGTIPPD